MPCSDIGMAKQCQCNARLGQGQWHAMQGKGISNDQGMTRPIGQDKGHGQRPWTGQGKDKARQWHDTDIGMASGKTMTGDGMHHGEWNA